MPVPVLVPISLSTAGEPRYQRLTGHQSNVPLMSCQRKSLRLHLTDRPRSEATTQHYATVVPHLAHLVSRRAKQGPSPRLRRTVHVQSIQHAHDKQILAGFISPSWDSYTCRMRPVLLLKCILHSANEWSLLYATGLEETMTINSLLCDTSEECSESYPEE